MDDKVITLDGTFEEQKKSLEEFLATIDDEN